MADLDTPYVFYGEWKGNGCCCTPGCYRAKVAMNPICQKGFCLYPGICGCGPSCPEPCGVPYMPCGMCGLNVYYDPCCGGGCLKFYDASTVQPLCCGCGCGYTKKVGAPTANEEMER